ncbi:MAG: hypothetical protein JW900_00425 [Anaerolineae bacterium]|nr:hypothetical protein [Anaerolineae bacterium]
MLKARWHGYEIDSSEAAYEIEVPQPERLGTLVRGLLTSGYFVRSYYLLFEEPLRRLRDFVAQQGDESAAKVLGHLEQQLAKCDADEARASRIGVKAIEAILNYVGEQGQKLQAAETFRFGLLPFQVEMYQDYDMEFEPGDEIEEMDYYSEEEIPLDGVVLYLGCTLVPANKLGAKEQRRVYKLIEQSFRQVGLLQELQSWDLFGGKERDYVAEAINRSHNLTLRVRLNPDATFSVTGRWMDDGQFIFPYYDYLLRQAAKGLEIEPELYVL